MFGPCSSLWIFPVAHAGLGLKGLNGDKTDLSNFDFTCEHSVKKYRSGDLCSTIITKFDLPRRLMLSAAMEDITDIERVGIGIEAVENGG